MSIYEWVRAIHILAVIALMAGILYLPRLFVYHVKHITDNNIVSIFRIMETNLLKIIINPSLIIVWILGLWLFHVRADSQGLSIILQPWMFIKMMCAVILTAYHGFLVIQYKKLQTGLSSLTEKQWRLANEIPFLLAIIMVISVVIEYGN